MKTLKNILYATIAAVGIAACGCVDNDPDRFDNVNTLRLPNGEIWEVHYNYPGDISHARGYETGRDWKCWYGNKHQKHLCNTNNAKIAPMDADLAKDLDMMLEAQKRIMDKRTRTTFKHE